MSKELSQLERIASNVKSNPESVGNRLKSARMLSGLTRKAFAAKSKISAATLRIWEEPGENRQGLSIKGAERIVIALNHCNVHCSKEWLLTGNSIGPKFISNTFSFDDIPDDKESWSEEEAIIKDIESFKNNNPNSIICMITDNAMSPYFSVGDYVGGCLKYGEDIKKLVGLNCVVSLEDRNIVRRITAFGGGNSYTLTVINYDKNIENPILTDINIQCAAEIIWHRWR